MDANDELPRRELHSAAKLTKSDPLRRPFPALGSSSDASGPSLSSAISGEAARRRLMLSAIRRWRFRAASRAVSQRLASWDPPDRGAIIGVQARPVQASATTSSSVLLSPSSSLGTTLSAQRSEAFRAAIQRARDVAHAAEEPYRAARNAAQRRVEVRQTAAAAQRHSAVTQRSTSVRRQRLWAGGPELESPEQECEPWVSAQPAPPPRQFGLAGVSATERRRSERRRLSTFRRPASAPRASEHRSSLSGAAAWADAQRAGRTASLAPGSSPAGAGHCTVSHAQEGQQATRPVSTSASRSVDGRWRGPTGVAAAHVAASDVDPELREVGGQIVRVRAAILARNHTTPSIAQSYSGRPPTATASSGVTDCSEASLERQAEHLQLEAGPLASQAVDIGRLGDELPKPRRTLRALDGNMAVFRLRRRASEGAAAQEHPATGCLKGEEAGSAQRRQVGREVRQDQHARSTTAVPAAVGSAAGGCSCAQLLADGAGVAPLESGRVGAAFAKARAAELRAEAEAARDIFFHLAVEPGAAREPCAAAGSKRKDHRTSVWEASTPGERAIAGANEAAAAAQAAAAEARRQIAEVVQLQLRRVMDCWRCWVLRRRWERQAKHATRLRFVSDGTKKSLVQLRRTRSFDIPKARHRLPHQRSPPAMSIGISAPQPPQGLGRQRQCTSSPVQVQVGGPSTPRPREPASWDALLLACATLGRSDRQPVQNWLVLPAAAARLARNAGS
jgi:hypothetical protein